MHLIFVTNARFTKTKNGRIYGINTSLNYNAFQHYLRSFSKIFIIARVDKSTRSFNVSLQINKGSVEILEIQDFKGLAGFLANQSLIKHQLEKYLSRSAVVICRVPGALGRMAAGILKAKGKPFALEVVGDPRDVFAPGAIKHPLRPLIRVHGIYHLKKLAKSASAVLYVTKKTLQNRYPASNGIYTTYASNVLLTEEAFTSQSKRLTLKDSYTITSIGSLEQMYKGPDILLKALQILVNSSVKVNLVWIGDGKYLQDMQLLSKKLGLEEFVQFRGIIKPASHVRALLDESDIFVLPSRTEGLPRALIEAMARGLPCIATNIGGIPELLEEDALVPINDVQSLASKILVTLQSPNQYKKMSKKNLRTAKEYDYDSLNSRRVEFYETIKATAQKKASK